MTGGFPWPAGPTPVPLRASTSFVLALRAAGADVDPRRGTGVDWHQSGNPGGGAAAEARP